MKAQTSPTELSPELLRLEVLRTYKQRLNQSAEFNESPFALDLVQRYGSKPPTCDVAAIHGEVRQRLETILKQVHKRQAPQVVILTGDPGMGKSHLIQSFRDPAKASELDYVLVCNSNHWKASEFERCLLSWIVTALTRPNPDQGGFLLERVEDIAFQALRQILTRPGEIMRFKPRSVSNVLARFWHKLTGNEHSRFLDLVERRDVRVFGQLDFSKFATEVCKRYLVDGGNRFHRYVVHVLLRYLFPEDRELVLAWLEGQKVGEALQRKLGVQDEIDRHDKVFSVLQILVSLYTPEVTAQLAGRDGKPCQSLVFFFAFDQAEARESLFESPEEWRKFFGQVSELYNTLPNVFVLFTMTKGLRQEYLARMEGQFRDRIHHDQQFYLEEIKPAEMLSLYRQRVEKWLGEEAPGICKRLEALSNPFQPFDQVQVLKLTERATLRDALKMLDVEFRKALDQTVIDVPLDFQVTQKELRLSEEGTSPSDYTANHFDTLRELFESAGEALTGPLGAKLSSNDIQSTDTNLLPAVRLQFTLVADPSRWVRVFLLRLPHFFNDKIEESVRLLANLQKSRNFLWLVRANSIKSSIADEKPGQIFPRELPIATETDLQAVVALWRKKDQYSAQAWTSGQAYLLEQVKRTYLGEMLEEVRKALAALPSAPMTAGVAAATA